MDGKRLLQRLKNSENAFKGVIGSVEKKIYKKVNFDFSINYQDSDGFVILNYETSNVAPFEQCVEMIKRDGCLTVENHKSISI